MSETKGESSVNAGKIVDGIYVFTPQIALDSQGRRRFSHLFVRLVDAPGKLNETNWELVDEPSKPVINEYITGKLPIPSGLVAALWGETGQTSGKTLRSAPTYISVGKNLGKKNETNLIQQAIKDGETKWNKNARKGGYVTKESHLGVIQANHVKPMALHSFPPQPVDGEFNILGTSYWREGEPCYVQRKVDGNRLVAGLDVSRSPMADLWGRSGDTPPNPLAKIKTQLEELMRTQPSSAPLVLDGEVYKHGMPHQMLNGKFMNKDENTDDLEYHVFDIIDTEKPWSMRCVQLAEIFARAPDRHPNVKLVQWHLVNSSAEIEKLYRQFLRDGYEGAVLRLPAGMYEAGTRKEMRSKSVLKLKPVLDSEFEITGYKSGEGRDAGAIIWVLKTSAGKEFNARPAETIEERQKLFAEMPARFATDFLGKMMRISYGNMTEDGVPRFPRVIGLREQIA